MPVIGMIPRQAIFYLAPSNSTNDIRDKQAPASVGMPGLLVRKHPNLDFSSTGTVDEVDVLRELSIVQIGDLVGNGRLAVRVSGTEAAAVGVEEEHVVAAGAGEHVIRAVVVHGRRELDGVVSG